MDVESDDQVGELPAVTDDETGGPRRPHRFRPIRLTLKVFAFVAIFYFGVLPLIPGFGDAIKEFSDVNPVLLVVGFALELIAFASYSMMTRAALGEVGRRITPSRLFRIQMATRALSSVLPGGNAAGSALGYRLMTLSGIDGPSAGFSLATSGLISAVVLNLILWVGLIVSIPIRGVNPLYASAAIAGIILMAIAATLVLGLMEGKGRAEQALRWIARKLHLSEDRAAKGLEQIGERLDELTKDRQLLGRVAGWAIANWLFDAAALWVFLRAFGHAPPVDGLIVAFGLANVLSVIPLTPGGLGIVEGVYIPTLVGFGLTTAVATVGVASYRFAQLWFPIVLGAILYLTLRAGPWSISRARKLARLRDLAAKEAERDESALDFAVRFQRRLGPSSSTPGHPQRGGEAGPSAEGGPP